jgi:hypothetical protein
MALYQYTFYLVERKSLEDLSAAREFIEGVSFNEEPYWIYNHRLKSLFWEVDGILEKNKSWSTEIDLYGIQDGNCLEVSFDAAGYITSASFRIDFRNHSENILDKIVAFCIIKDLAIIDAQNLNVLAPDHKLIYNIIKSSKQWKTYYSFMSK